MKRFLTVALVIFGSAVATLAQNNTTTYNSAVDGELNKGMGPNTVVVSGSAKDDLAGVYRLMVRYNPETHEITSGDWSRTVVEQQADGSQTEVGTLHGDVAGGSVTFDEQGNLTSISNAVLSITGGNKAFASTAGNGLFEANFATKGNAPHPPSGTPPPTNGEKPSISGTMKLIF